MKIKTAQVTEMTISEIDGLDPVHVIFKDTADRQGRVTITCFGKVWTAYWGAMGDGRTVSEFFRTASNSEYLVNCLDRGIPPRIADPDWYEDKDSSDLVDEFGNQIDPPMIENTAYTYLLKIVNAVREALTQLEVEKCQAEIGV